MRKEHAARLLSEGIVRIGTLYEYRDIEKHGPIVGDDLEGTKSAAMHVAELTMSKQVHVPELVQDRVKVVGNTTVRMINSRFVVSEGSPNYYIYSVAEEHSPSLQASLGYDTCLRIDDPNGFFSALSRALRHHVSEGALHRCVYMPREVPHTEQREVHPAVIKDPRYANQKEYRFIWQPTGTNIHPLMLRCRRVLRWCSLMA